MPTQEKRAERTFVYVTFLFFIWGAVTSINDVLIPAVRSIFSLSVTEGLLTQFAFFLAYGLVSLPASGLVARLGPSRSITLALGTMVIGCLLMPVATSLRAYWIVLVALFVIAAGITLLQLAANPLSAALGKPEKSHFRLTLSQAFNSLGTLIAPPLAAFALLRGGIFAGGTPTEAKIADSLSRIDIAYVLIAAIIVGLAIFLSRQRDSINRAIPPAVAGQESVMQALRSRWAVFGACAIFLYVGAEVSIGSIIINFLERADILGVSAARGGQLIMFYWGGAMVGRFIGSALLTRFSAGRLLSVAACIAAVLCLTVTQLVAAPAAIAMLSIGLFNAIMFPTIFSLTLERSNAAPAATAGLLCTAVVGGAFVPLLFGHVADGYGLSVAFLVPAAAYVVIAVFGIAAARTRPVSLVAAATVH